nr:MAG TPA: hypothetical protein [Caudoviricetes sp.]
MFQHNQVCSRQDIPYSCFRLLKIRLIRGVLYKKTTSVCAMLLLTTWCR